MPIPRTVNSWDFLDEFRRLSDRVRRLEMDMSAGAGQVESFIMDPITVRAWPAAIACNMRISGVLLYAATVATPVDVTYWFIPDGGSATVLHQFSGATANNVYSALEDDMTYGDVLDLAIGDLYYPEVTAGAGSNISCGFITLPGWYT